MSPALALARRNNPIATLLWGLCIIGSLLIVYSSVSYVMPDGDHPFLDERPALAAWSFWRLSLSSHVAASLFCLPVGLLLSARRAAVAFPRLHKVVGRLYAVLFLFIVAPTGVALSFFAKGGWTTGPGFFLSASFGALAFIIAIRAATRREIARHEDWMLRSYMQLAGAITFRVVHIALQLCDAPYEANYIISLWTSVVGNALLAELIIAVRRQTWRKYVRSHP